MSNLTALKDELEGCTKCRLSNERTNLVFGAGSPEAEIMLVGEGPGRNEDEQGEPFVGRAGGLLTKLLTKVGVDRESVYIANVVKCRPPNNRDPRRDEIAACSPHLRQQVLAIKPKVIIGLGKFAGNYLTHQHGLSMASLRELDWVYDRDGYKVWVVPTYHPASILYQDEKGKREIVQKMVDDLRKALRLMDEELPTDDETEELGSLLADVDITADQP